MSKVEVEANVKSVDLDMPGVSNIGLTLCIVPLGESSITDWKFREVLLPVDYDAALNAGALLGKRVRITLEEIEDDQP